MGRLDGRVAIVTGAGRGIGAEVARLLAAEGAQVVVNDPGVSIDGTGEDQSLAKSIADSINLAGGTAVADFSDVTDPDQSKALVSRALDTYGGLHVLANVAGILRDGMVFNLSHEDWKAVLKVHLDGTFNTTRHAAEFWRANRIDAGYRLINFTSIAGLFGAPGQPNYSAAKAGIVGFTYSCAAALGRYGVTANAVSPAALTRMAGTIDPEKAAELGLDREDLSPAATAFAVAYLASVDSSWLTGRVIGCRGGRISLFARPTVEREVIVADGWSVDSVFEEFPRAFDPDRAAMGGMA